MVDAEYLIFHGKINPVNTIKKIKKYFSITKTKDDMHLLSSFLLLEFKCKSVRLF